MARPAPIRSGDDHRRAVVADRSRRELRRRDRVHGRRPPGRGQARRSQRSRSRRSSGFARASRASSGTADSSISRSRAAISTSRSATERSASTATWFSARARCTSRCVIASTTPSPATRSGSTDGSIPATARSLGLPERRFLDGSVGVDRELHPQPRRRRRGAGAARPHGGRARAGRGRDREAGGREGERAVGGHGSTRRAPSTCGRWSSMRRSSRAGLAWRRPPSRFSSRARRSSG